MGYMGGYDTFSYQYDTTAPVVAGIGGFFLVFLLVFYLAVIAFGVAVYVLESLSIYTIAKRRSIHNPWLAWVPVANVWVLGSISDQYQYVAKGNVRNRRKVLLGLGIASVALSVLAFVVSFALGLFNAGLTGVAAGASFAVLVLIEFVAAVIGLVQLVFFYIALYDLYASCDPGNATLYLVLSIIFNVTIAVFMFICRKKDEGMPPRRKPVVEEPVPVQPEICAADVLPEENFDNEPVAEPDDFEDTPVEEAAVEEAPVEETPVEEAPVEETPAEEVPVEKTPESPAE